MARLGLLSGGRRSLEVRDLVLVFTLVPGPASPAEIPLGFDAPAAAGARDRAWVTDTPHDNRGRVSVCAAARRLLMAAGAAALSRGRLVVEVDDLLLALFENEQGIDMFTKIGVDPYRARQPLVRERLLSAAAGDSFGS